MSYLVKLNVKIGPGINVKAGHVLTQKELELIGPRLGEYVKKGFLEGGDGEPAPLVETEVDQMLGEEFGDEEKKPKKKKK